MLLCRKISVLSVGLVITLGTTLFAQENVDEPAADVLTSKQWKVLHSPGRKVARTLPLPEDSPLKSLADLQFTGPAPDSPFVLGQFAVDCDWQLLNGYLLPMGGKNAALQVTFADQFELEGTIEQTGFGGWFILAGWDEGRGFSVSNVTMMTAESGSPWFLTSYRGGKAIEGTHQEFGKFEWKGEQPFKLHVKNQTLSLQVGRTVLFDAQPLEGYVPGAVIIGTYDTRYGPKKIRIKSLRVRAVEAEQKPAK